MDFHGCGCVYANDRCFVLKPFVGLALFVPSNTFTHIYSRLLTFTHTHTLSLSLSRPLSLGQRHACHAADLLQRACSHKAVVNVLAEHTGRLLKLGDIGVCPATPRGELWLC